MNMTQHDSDTTARSAANLLLRQYRELTDPKRAIPSFHIELEDDSNIFTWNIGVMVLNKDSIYHGGYFQSQMKFPKDFPFSPPQFKFIPPIYHPNVYRDGKLCISILHQSGDAMTSEPDNETWSPVQSVESVLISIVSLLEDPNVSSPANVDAAVEYRKNYNEYKKKVLQQVERSRQCIPNGFVMPTSDTAAYISKKEVDDIKNIENEGQENNRDGSDRIRDEQATKDITDGFWNDSENEEYEDGDEVSMIFEDDYEEE
ncbi:hypothetical protein NCAS_0I01430 [Naumovozyma castellii]|uniref:UBC core domain-containing protein n=1 Tax=Naumovozyma castellii TaxID=27288 RepID=G0VJX9_NAUCA|nr:hypothetical protein NCAS_0I01430 [Naumovozyma castellii CBS 4309]CCC71811.1 hypothetical protein NCAS_0I01430 [Naumovozyma castellii CBS 4309]